MSTDTFVGAVLPNSNKVTRVTDLGIREYLLTKKVPPNIYVFKSKGIYAEPISIAADMSDRMEFFESLSLPRVYVFPVVRTTYWLAVPSVKEHYKRYIRYSIPLPLVFTPDNLSPLDPVVARVYRGRRVYLLFEDYHYRYDQELIEKARSYLKEITSNPLRSKVKEPLKLPAELREAVKIIADQTTPPLERMVKHSLGIVGAELVSLEDLGLGRYRVTYIYKGIRDFIDIDDSLFCVDIGICVDGHDRDFDLASGILVKHERSDLDY